ncbi:MAG: Holliday junction resolvase RuvX [Saprospiraceae bacterium]
MGRVLCIDFGTKRCGIAATDPLQIIVSPVDTVPTDTLLDFLHNYLHTESVEKIVIGLPVHKDGNFTHIKLDIDVLATQLRLKYPEILIDFADEQYSSVIAKQRIIDIGTKMHKRRDKALIDRMSAVVILQKYLNHI